MKSRNNVHRTVSASVGPVLGLFLCVPWLSACESEVIVEEGVEPGEEEGECTSCQEALPPYEGMGACASDDEVVRSEYERWARSPNLLGNLPPGSWEGTIAGNPATLRVGEDFSASLIMGTPTPLDADVGPFCTGSGIPYDCGALFSPGGVHPIHGAEWSPGELAFTLKDAMIYDEWCKLQPPTDEWSGAACAFTPEGAVVTFSQGPLGVCTIGDAAEPMDCARVQLINYHPMCACASDGCFPQPYLGDEGVLISLRTSDDGVTFEGEGPEGEVMQFARVD